MMQFPSRPTCPKCGQASPKPTWHAELSEGLVRVSCDEPPEHLHWKCSNCGYLWMTDTADKR